MRGCVHVFIYKGLCCPAPAPPTHMGKGLGSLVPMQWCLWRCYISTLPCDPTPRWPVAQLQHLLICTQFGLSYGFEFNKMYRIHHCRNIHVILIWASFFFFLHCPYFDITGAKACRIKCLKYYTFHLMINSLFAFLAKNTQVIMVYYKSSIYIPNLSLKIWWVREEACSHVVITTALEASASLIIG